jgi:uncharacterized protein YigE (DUF2233 family)
MMTIFVLSGFLFKCNTSNHPDERFDSFTVDHRDFKLQMLWLDSMGVPLSTFSRLMHYIERDGSSLVFAMNGGMFNPDYSPKGLFIHEGKMYTALDTSSGTGNFYLKPNGVFYITHSGTAAICSTSDYPLHDSIWEATQSGPMLLMNRKINPLFDPWSKNVQVRNGVGILNDGKVILAISHQAVTFYDFAKYFLHMGCSNALYLDGYVSKVYRRGDSDFTRGEHFGVMISVSDSRE